MDSIKWMMWFMDTVAYKKTEYASKSCRQEIFNTDSQILYEIGKIEARWYVKKP